MDPLVFSHFVNSLIARKLEKDKNLRQESKRFWECILNGTYDFDRGKLLDGVYV
jgi:secreted Zn-dependent insulinase-like peptidase